MKLQKYILGASPEKQTAILRPFDDTGMTGDWFEFNAGIVYKVSDVDNRIAVLEKALRELKQSHHMCDDRWYSCPLSKEGCANEHEPKECNCGAGRINAKIDAVLGHSAS